MKRNLSLLVVFLIVIAVVSLITLEQTHSKTSLVQASLVAAPLQENLASSSPEMLEHVPYMILFHHIRVIKEQAEENERQSGRKSALPSRFMEEASLNDNQFQMLKTVALDCEQQVQVFDKKAQVIIEAARARFPGGVIPQGQELPPPPPELLSLQREHDALILRCRDRVRASLGEQEFVRFKQFVQRRIVSNLRIETPNSRPSQ
jgi:hypothetical protein